MGICITGCACDGHLHNWMRARRYYDGAGGVVFVVDSTDETRFPDVAAALGAGTCDIM